jgi:uncharacterized protein
MSASPTPTPIPAPPWWRVGMVWLVLGGPAAVVVASLVTVTIAYVGAEEVLTQPTKQISSEGSAHLPAVQGRNHVATPRN